MTVRDLIAVLSRLNPETRVLVDGYEYGLDDPHPALIRAAIDVGGASCGGKHADAIEDKWMFEDATEPPALVDAIVLSRKKP